MRHALGWATRKDRPSSTNGEPSYISTVAPDAAVTRDVHRPASREMKKSPGAHRSAALFLQVLQQHATGAVRDALRDPGRARESVEPGD
jgi:hypothetical protein